MTGLEKLHQVQIGPIRYRVEHTYPIISSNNEMLYGQIAYEEAVIQVSSRAAPSLAPVILMHEILHGMISQAGLKIDNEEQVVEALAHALVDFIERNQPEETAT